MAPQSVPYSLSKGKLETIWLGWTSSGKAERGKEDSFILYNVKKCCYKIIEKIRELKKIKETIIK